MLCFSSNSLSHTDTHTHHNITVQKIYVVLLVCYCWLVYFAVVCYAFPHNFHFPRLPATTTTTICSGSKRKSMAMVSFSNPIPLPKHHLSGNCFGLPPLSSQLWSFLPKTRTSSSSSFPCLLLVISVDYRLCALHFISSLTDSVWFWSSILFWFGFWL